MTVSRYHKLLSDYERLSQECMNQKAQLMECEYQYEMLKKEYQEQVNSQAEIKVLHESARRLKHDMKNHMLVLAAYLNDGEIEEAKEYVSGIFDILNQMYTYIETGNTILNYCINTKLLLANEHKIPFKAEVENLSFHRVDSLDLTAILTNLLDNAIEGCVNVTDPLIEIVISKKRNLETILIRNRINHSVLEQNPSLYSTKQATKEHGYGIPQVRTLVQKYDGMLDIYEEGSMFCVCVAVYP